MPEHFIVLTNIFFFKQRQNIEIISSYKMLLKHSCKESARRCNADTVASRRLNAAVLPSKKRKKDTDLQNRTSSHQKCRDPDRYFKDVGLLTAI